MYNSATVQLCHNVLDIIMTRIVCITVKQCNGATVWHNNVLARYIGPEVHARCAAVQLYNM